MMNQIIMSLKNILVEETPHVGVKSDSERADTIIVSCRNRPWVRQLHHTQ